MSAMCSQASGTSIIIACRTSRPERSIASRALSSPAESEPPLQQIGFSHSMSPPQMGEVGSGSRAPSSCGCPTRC